MSSETTSLAEPLTIVICTRNRVRFLCELLDSLSRCDEFPTTEVIVVDNGSADSTAESCRTYTERFPNIRYVYEPQTGLSFARNTGLWTAGTPYVLFLDDDCTVETDYVKRARTIVREHSPDFFGGPIIPRFRGDEPAWLHHIEKVKFHQPNTGFHPSGRLTGGNFGMRRALKDSIGFFRTDLGMRGEKVGVYEEKELLDRYCAAVPARQRRIYYDIDLLIHHRILPHKCQKKFQLRRALLNGIAEAQSRVHFGGPIDRFSMLKKVIRQVGRQMKAFKTRGEPPAFITLTEIVHLGGRLIAIIFARSGGPVSETLRLDQPIAESEL